MPQPEELGRSVITSALAGASHLAVLIGAWDVEVLYYLSLCIWVLIVPAGYFARSYVRAALMRRGYYCVPYVIVGSGSLAEAAIREMQADPELGLVPVAVFGDTARFRAPTILGVPVLGPIAAAQGYAFA
jgi:FlaA1/EpsC-like NDP-sugar epimerase